jgi:hypothetical protein
MGWSQIGVDRTVVHQYLTKVETRPSRGASVGYSDTDETISQFTETRTETDMDSLYYDYDNQCWIADGRIESCNHPKTMNCKCYGKLHAGEAATIEAIQRASCNEQAAAWDARCEMGNED